MITELLENVGYESPYGNYTSYDFFEATHGEGAILGDFYVKQSKDFIKTYAYCTLFELQHLEKEMSDADVKQQKLFDFIKLEREFLEFMVNSPEENSEYYDKRHKCIFMIFQTYEDIQKKLEELK